MSARLIRDASTLRSQCIEGSGHVVDGGKEGWEIRATGQKHRHIEVSKFLRDFFANYTPVSWREIPRETSYDRT